MKICLALPFVAHKTIHNTIRQWTHDLPGLTVTTHGDHLRIDQPVKVQETDHVAKSPPGIYRLQHILGILKSLITETSYQFWIILIAAKNNQLTVLLHWE